MYLNIKSQMYMNIRPQIYRILSHRDIESRSNEKDKQHTEKEDLRQNLDSG